MTNKTNHLFSDLEEQMQQKVTTCVAFLKLVISDTKNLQNMDVYAFSSIKHVLHLIMSST